MATDYASENVIESWVEELTGPHGRADYMVGWSTEDYKVVATQLAHALKRERAKSPEGLEARVAALEENSHRPVDVTARVDAAVGQALGQMRASLRTVASDEYRRMTNDPQYREWVDRIVGEAVQDHVDVLRSQLRAIASDVARREIRGMAASIGQDFF